MLPKISIIVPLYNVEDYIDECVKSIVYQTYKNIEIILVDDGSDDRSITKCHKWAQRDKRIRVVSNDHKGVSIARNTGIEISTGKWISFVDGDDCIELSMIERLLLETQKDDYDIVIAGYSVIHQRTKIVGHFFDNDTTFDLADSSSVEILLKEAILGHSNSVTNVGVPWGKLYKKSFIENGRIRFVPGLSRMQDTVFNLTAFTKQTGKVRYIDEPLYTYRLRRNSATKAYRTDFHDTALWIVDLLGVGLNKANALLHGRFIDEVVYAKRVSLFSETIRLELIPKECPYSLKEKIQRIKKMEKLFLVHNGQINGHRVDGVFLSKKQRIIVSLVNKHMELILFMMLSAKNRIKR